MTIYTQGGAPVELVAIYKGGEQTKLMGFWLFKAKLIGTYRDGSGTMGDIVFGTDRTARGWATTGDFRADGGFAELDEAANKLPESPEPENYGQIMNYYWPRCFNKKGRYLEDAA